MTKPSLVVPLADLEHGPKHVTFTLSEAWLKHALEGTEAVPAGLDGTLSLTLSKNGREVMVRGAASVDVVLPCARTLEPVPYKVEPEVFLLLAPRFNATAPSPRKRLKRRAAEEPHQRGKRRPGKAATRGGWGTDPELRTADAARDTFEGDEVVLDGFIREFILLDLPMFPLRSDLRSAPDAAIAPAREAEPRPVDPRLLPLADLLTDLAAKNLAAKKE
ncbi:MAG TPA: DUF177 domain-containing protein [Polyangiaceae bacterium]